MRIPSKKELEESLKISFDGKNRVEVIKPLIYELEGDIIIIPKGFKSDGVSNPFIRNKLDISVLAFGILHDYGYRTQFIKSRIRGDLMAIVILSETADNGTAYTYYFGTRVFGWYPGYNNKRNGLEKYPMAKTLKGKYGCNKYNICR